MKEVAELTKRFLAMGSNYPGTSFQLAGCVNDARDWAELLTSHGYEGGFLLDAAMTRAAMLEEMTGLVEHAELGDHIVITYSGHGTWVPDTDGDEADRRDEAICPTDLRSAGVITDDDLYEIFTRAVYGVRLIFVADSCYSGTIARLAGPLEPGGMDLPGRQVRFLAPSVWAPEHIISQPVWRAAEAAGPSGRPRRSALALSGCAEHEVAYDAWFGARANGAYTYAAIQAFKALGGEPVSYAKWQRQIRGLLPSVDYPQTPQLQGTSTQRRWQVLA